MRARPWLRIFQYISAFLVLHAYPVFWSATPLQEDGSHCLIPLVTHWYANQTHTFGLDGKVEVTLQVPGVIINHTADACMRRGLKFHATGFRHMDGWPVLAQVSPQRRLSIVYLQGLLVGGERIQPVRGLSLVFSTS